MKNWDFDHFLESLGFEPSPYFNPSDRPLARSSLAATDSLRTKLVIVTAPLQGEARELCLKMIHAMKLPTAQLEHVELALADLMVLETELRDRTQICLVMGLEFASTLLGTAAGRGQAYRHADWHTVEIWATHSPEDVLLDAALKRPVWDDLQSVLRNFSPHGIS
ncbi:MAG: hypothetical protein ABIR96_03650 [Bdellovibrionota bacterium]